MKTKKNKKIKGGTRCFNPPNPTYSTICPAPPNPAPPHSLPPPKCQFQLFRPLVLSQFGGKYTKNNKKKMFRSKFKKNKKTRKNGGARRSQRIYAPQPMLQNDEREINLCLYTPERFNKQWVHQNLVSNNHLPIDSFSLDFYIQTWNNHIDMCNEWQDWAYNDHVTDGSLYDFAAKNLQNAIFNSYDSDIDEPIEEQQEDISMDYDPQDYDSDGEYIWE